MGFLKKYYEKIILAVFLLVFIISLILLILALIKSQEIKEEELKFPVKQPEYKRINPEDFSVQKNFESEKRWAKVTARTEGDKNFTDMLVPYQIARCPSPGCQKLIPRSCFVQGGKCPVCAYDLRDPVESGKITDQSDSDEDGIPDKDETAVGLNPEDSADAAKDLDNDGFSNLEEFRAGTKINDPKSHPPYAKRLYIKSIERNKLPMVLTKVTPHGEDKNTWSIQVEQDVDGRQKTKFYKINSGIMLNGKKYEIKDITLETVEEPVDKKNTRKRDVFTIILQAEGDDRQIKAKEKEDVLENNERVKTIDAFTEKEYNVAVDETFSVGDATGGEEKYTVKSVDSSKKTVIIKKNDNGAEYELTQKVLEYKRGGEDDIQGNIPAVENPAVKPPTVKSPPAPARAPAVKPNMPPGGKVPPGMMMPPGGGKVPPGVTGGKMPPGVTGVKPPGQDKSQLRK